MITTQKTLPDGSVNSLTQTVVPVLTDMTLTTSVTFLQQYTNYLSIIQSFTDSVDRCIRFDKAQSSNEFVNDTIGIFSEVDGKYKTLDNQFLVQWIDKYNRCIETIKQLVKSQVGTDSVFGQISDSIGLLSNTQYMLTDAVVPYNDINCSSYPAPITYPANLANKIRPVAADVASKMSKLTTTMFRQNIINIQFQYATSQESHGSNLITDIVSYTRARKYVGTIVKQLQSDYTKLFKLFGYFCNINDHTGYNAANLTLNKSELTGNLYFTMVIEGAQVNIDLLGKRIRETRQNLSIANSLVSTAQ